MQTERVGMSCCVSGFDFRFSGTKPPTERAFDTSRQACREEAPLHRPGPLLPWPWRSPGASSCFCRVGAAAGALTGMVERVVLSLSKACLPSQISITVCTNTSGCRWILRTAASALRRQRGSSAPRPSTCTPPTRGGGVERSARKRHVWSAEPHTWWPAQLTGQNNQVPLLKQQPSVQHADSETQPWLSSLHFRERATIVRCRFPPASCWRAPP